MKNFNKIPVIIAFAIILSLGSAFLYADSYLKELPPEDQPLILLPENGQIVYSLTATLSWGEVPSSEYYNITLSHYQGENLVEIILTTKNGKSLTTPTEILIGNEVLDYATQYFWKVQACNSYGSGPWSEACQFQTENPNVGPDNPFNTVNSNSSAKEVKLNNNYPNPFNPVTKINYEIKTNSFVKITVYNILGKEVKTLVNSFQNAGMHSTEFNASSLASGIYICRLESNGVVLTSKMNLIK
jgi:hypothetical protein